MNLEITRHSDDFEDQIGRMARLKTANWGLDPDVFRSYVKWNYADRPESVRPIVYFASSGGETIAMRAIYETSWRVKGGAGRHQILCSGDLLILEAHRGRGIYRELTGFVMDDLANSGAGYLLSMNPTPRNAAISLSSGWKGLGEIAPMKKEFRTPGRKALELVRKIAEPHARKLLTESGVGFIRRMRKPKNSRRISSVGGKVAGLPAYVTVDTSPRPAEMAALVEATLPENKLTPLRDERFFRWRYNNPLSDYLFLYYNDGGLKGYLVLQSHVYSMEYGGSRNILELEGSDSRVKTVLLKALLSLVNSGTISIWGSMLDEAGREYLLSEGFGDDSAKGTGGSPHTVMLRPFGEGNDEVRFRGLNLLDAKSWDFIMTSMNDH